MRAALAIAILAVGGCATKAQQEALRIQGVATADAPVIDACWRGTVASPPYQALKAKMGEYSDSPTLAMKTNTQHIPRNRRSMHHRRHPPHRLHIDSSKPVASVYPIVVLFLDPREVYVGSRGLWARQCDLRHKLPLIRIVILVHRLTIYHLALLLRNLVASTGDTIKRDTIHGLTFIPRGHL